MRIRFLQSVGVAGGPLYHPGDVVETDPHFVTSQRAEQYVERGWAEPVVDILQAAASTGPSPKAPTVPPVDKMVREPAVKKDVRR